MAATKDLEQTVSTNQLAEAFAAAMRSVQPTKEIKEGDPEYVARQREEGWFDDFFGVTVLQNAYEAQARGLSEETRRRASQLRPGAYIKGRVKVTVEQNGKVVRLSYPVKGDNLQNNRDHWSSFTDLIDKIWAEMGPQAA
jgi:hypothetical protein